MSDHPMGERSTAGLLSALDIRIWTEKSVRECVAIASRLSKGSDRKKPNPGLIDALLSDLIEALQAERDSLPLRYGLAQPRKAKSSRQPPEDVGL